MNDENLKPFTSDQSREEAVKNGRKGGKASGKARRERRRFEETLRIMLTLPTKEGKVTDAAKLKTLSKDELEAANLTVQDKIAVRLINEAMKGSVKAYEAIRDQMGEKPTDRQEVTVSGSVAVDLDTADINQILAEVRKLKKDDVQE